MTVRRLNIVWHKILVEAKISTSWTTSPRKDPCSAFTSVICKVVSILVAVSMNDFKHTSSAIEDRHLDLEKSPTN
uniref:Uncharacterized protein n=1 Tax=Physcomitrium patens TaxID=3218 RepID=A0A2K1IYQ4_PHYPA|nr:hypothetical protein PHYPA_024221 [Physcomitrium patens]